MAKAGPSIMHAGPLDTIPENAPRGGYPASRNETFAVAERPLTERLAASSYNNFYEFISAGDLKNVWPLVGDYNPFPSTIKVSGLVEKSFEIDVAELIESMDLEERVYRFRCVEAWSMTIPWTGFPLKKLIERCAPTSRATHVAFLSADKPKEMPGITNAPWYDWPYFEGLRLNEAMNDLAFMATGMYGEPLPKQNGSPMRLVLPWKYGYKGPKAITELKFTNKQPATFWNKLQPAEYGFLSNVNPMVPHPRWTQASERYIQSEVNIERRETLPFNGYTEFVQGLYPDEPTTLTRTIR
ncbi:MAG: sulfoxide reductase catalytic subunit YedY [Rhodothermales bacterium]|jgi:sulfoxide reductase catalytic subunit YedY